MTACLARTLLLVLAGASLGTRALVASGSRSALDPAVVSFADIERASRRQAAGTPLPICVRPIAFQSSSGLATRARERLDREGARLVVVEEDASSASRARPWASDRTYYVVPEVEFVRLRESNRVCGDGIVARSAEAFFFGGSLWTETGPRRVVLSFHTLPEFAYATNLAQLLEEHDFEPILVRQAVVPDVDACTSPSSSSSSSASLEAWVEVWSRAAPGTPLPFAEACEYGHFVGQPGYPLRSVAHVLLHDPPRLPAHSRWAALATREAADPERRAFLASLEPLNSGVLFLSFEFGALCLHAETTRPPVGEEGDNSWMHTASLVCVDVGAGPTYEPESWSPSVQRVLAANPSLSTSRLHRLLRQRRAAAVVPDASRVFDARASLDAYRSLGAWSAYAEAPIPGRVPSSLSVQDTRFLRNHRRFRTRTLLVLQESLTCVVVLNPLREWEWLRTPTTHFRESLDPVHRQRFDEDLRSLLSVSALAHDTWVTPQLLASHAPLLLTPPLVVTLTPSPDFRLEVNDDDDNGNGDGDDEQGGIRGENKEGSTPSDRCTIAVVAAHQYPPLRALPGTDAHSRALAQRRALARTSLAFELLPDPLALDTTSAAWQTLPSTLQVCTEGRGLFGCDAGEQPCPLRWRPVNQTGATHPISLATAPQATAPVTTSIVHPQSVSLHSVDLVDADQEGPGAFVRRVRRDLVFLLAGPSHSATSPVSLVTDFGAWLQFLLAHGLQPVASGMEVRDGTLWHDWRGGLEDAVNIVVHTHQRIHLRTFREALESRQACRAARRGGRAVRTAIHTAWTHPPVTRPSFVPSARLATLARAAALGRVPVLRGSANDEPFEVRRWHLVDYLVQRFGFQRYLEIGCQSDHTFASVQVPVRVGVDPAEGGTLRMTSDAYFSDPSFANQTFQIVFVDGLHESQQALRDVENALARLEVGGFILMHDLLPRETHSEGAWPPTWPSNWNGDTWRAMASLRTRADLDAIIVDSDHGVGVLRRRPPPHTLSLPRPALPRNRTLGFQGAFEVVDGEPASVRAQWGRAARRQRVTAAPEAGTDWLGPKDDRSALLSFDDFVPVVNFGFRVMDAAQFVEWVEDDAR